jgi:hypothetical protein
MDAILAWSEAAAGCERLRAYRDLLDEQLGAESIEAYLTEVTELSETVVRPAMGAEKRESLVRQRESLDRALHRGEMRLRAMRNDLWRRLETSPRGQAIDYAVYWAQRAREREVPGGS